MNLDKPYSQSASATAFADRMAELMEEKARAEGRIARTQEALKAAAREREAFASSVGKQEGADTHHLNPEASLGGSSSSSRPGGAAQEEHLAEAPKETRSRPAPQPAIAGSASSEDYTAESDSAADTPFNARAFQSQVRYAAGLAGVNTAPAPEDLYSGSSRSSDTRSAIQVSFPEEPASAPASETGASGGHSVRRAERPLVAPLQPVAIAMEGEDTARAGGLAMGSTGLPGFPPNRAADRDHSNVSSTTSEQDGDASDSGDDIGRQSEEDLASLTAAAAAATAAAAAAVSGGSSVAATNRGRVLEGAAERLVSATTTARKSKGSAARHSSGKRDVRAEAERIALESARQEGDLQRLRSKVEQEQDLIRTRLSSVKQEGHGELGLVALRDPHAGPVEAVTHQEAELRAQATTAQQRLRKEVARLKGELRDREREVHLARSSRTLDHADEVQDREREGEREEREHARGRELELERDEREHARVQELEREREVREHARGRELEREEWEHARGRELEREREVRELEKHWEMKREREVREREQGRVQELEAQLRERSEQLVSAQAATQRLREEVERRVDGQGGAGGDSGQAQEEVRRPRRVEEESERQQMAQEVKSLRQRLAEQERVMATEAEEIRLQLTQEAEMLRRHLRDAQDDAQESETRALAAESKLSSAVQRVDSMEEKASRNLDSTAEVDRLRLTLKRMQVRSEQMEKRVNDFEGVEQRASSVMAQVAQLKKKLAERDAEVEQLAKKLAAAEGALENAERVHQEAAQLAQERLEASEATAKERLMEADARAGRLMEELAARTQEQAELSIRHDREMKQLVIHHGVKAVEEAGASEERMEMVHHLEFLLDEEQKRAVKAEEKVREVEKRLEELEESGRKEAMLHRATASKLKVKLTQRERDAKQAEDAVGAMRAAAVNAAEVESASSLEALRQSEVVAADAQRDVAAAEQALVAERARAAEAERRILELQGKLREAHHSMEALELQMVDSLDSARASAAAQSEIQRLTERLAHRDLAESDVQGRLIMAEAQYEAEVHGLQLELKQLRAKSDAGDRAAAAAEAVQMTSHTRLESTLEEMERLQEAVRKAEMEAEEAWNASQAAEARQVVAEERAHAANAQLGKMEQDLK
eukprot:gene13114-15484_t